MHFALDVALIYQLSFFSRYVGAYVTSKVLPELPEFEGSKQSPSPFEALAIGYWTVRVFPLSIAPEGVALLLISANTVGSFCTFVVLLVFIEAIHAFFSLPFPLYVAWRRFTIFWIFGISGFAAVHISWIVFKLHSIHK